MINLTELIEVTLPEPDNFLKVKETLSRIGIASKKDNTLYQSCHILHKQGKYYILHFKELFLLDGKRSDFSLDDKARRNTIANLLDEWQLVDLVDVSKSADPVASLSQIKVLSYKEKSEWTLVTKYSIGSKKEY
jgi:thiamine biosynthesis protein ThiC